MKRLSTQRIALALSAAALAAAGIALGLSSSGATPKPAAVRVVRVLDCANKPVVRPSTFVISCADANSELTRTHWSTWGPASAVGTTRFGLNLCVPYCAASRVQFFPNSHVRLSAPVRTKRHGWLYSSLVVTYKLHGKTKRFALSWKGTPAFS